MAELKKTIDEYGDEWFEDEAGGLHGCGIGWNPQGVWCGECGFMTCKGCSHELDKERS